MRLHQTECFYHFIGIQNAPVTKSVGTQCNFPTPTRASTPVFSDDEMDGTVSGLSIDLGSSIFKPEHTENTITDNEQSFS